MSDRHRELAIKQLMESALLIGRQHGLNSIQLIDVLVKTTGCVTEAAVNANTHRSAPEEPNGLTAPQAAQNSAFRMSYQKNEKGQSCYWLAVNGRFIFQSGTDWYIGSERPEDMDEPGWLPVEDWEVAATISEKARTL